jgi:N6-L-threonylcarbamoyladenine synthase
MSCVLGIETSCDETGVAIVAEGRRILANEVASQISVHAEFGGVVPEIASRQHILCISQLVKKALGDGGCSSKDIAAIAVTNGPGLMGSLLVGVCFGKALAYAWRTPFVPVHHIEGHIFSVFLSDAPPEFPFLTLIVSGGHTSLIWCEQPHNYRVLGATRDDAVGESFDKVARLLELPYPGGPSIERAAETGNPEACDFPRAMAQTETLDFSFSGLKTAVLYRMREGGISREDLAASFQWAAVDTLLIKTQQAIAQTGAKHLVLAGGVAANRLLRQRLAEEAGIPVSMPPLELCVDNGAMIAAAGYSRLQHGFRGDNRTRPHPGLHLE